MPGTYFDALNPNTKLGKAVRAACDELGHLNGMVRGGWRQQTSRHSCVHPEGRPCLRAFSGAVGWPARRRRPAHPPGLCSTLCVCRCSWLVFVLVCVVVGGAQSPGSLFAANPDAPPQPFACAPNTARHRTLARVQELESLKQADSLLKKLGLKSSIMDVPVPAAAAAEEPSDDGDAAGHAEQ